MLYSRVIKWYIQICFFIFFSMMVYHRILKIALYALQSVQLLSWVWLSGTSWTAACQASLSITNSESLLKFRSIESVMPSNHLILCYPLLLLPSIFPALRSFPVSQFFSSCCQRIWASASKEFSGLISFSINWLDLFAVQGTLKSLLRYNSVKASILPCSAFSMCFTIEPCLFILYRIVCIC